MSDEKSLTVAPWQMSSCHRSPLGTDTFKVYLLLESSALPGGIHGSTLVQFCGIR